MSKSKEVDNPYADDETNKVLTKKVDTSKVDSEKNSIDCHQTSITKLVKEDTRKKAGSKVYQTTNSTNYRINLNIGSEMQR